MITKSNFMGEDLPGDEPMVGVPLYLLNGETGLSSKACWYLTVIRTRPKGQGFTVDELGKPFDDGIRTTTAAIEELEEAGYLLRVQMRAETGAFAGKKWYASYYPRFKKNESEQEPETYASTDTTFRHPGVQNADTTKRQVGVQNVAPTAQNVKSVKNTQTPEMLPVSIGPVTQIEPENAVGAFVINTISIPVGSTILPEEKKIDNKEAPKKNSARKLTEVGDLLLAAYAKWRLGVHGQEYSKVSDGAAAAFNSMGKTLMVRYKKNAQQAAPIFAKVLERHPELDPQYYGSKFFSPTRLEQEFLSILNILEHAKGGGKSVAGAPSTAAEATAEQKRDAGLRKVALQAISSWRNYHNLPPLRNDTPVSDQDVTFYQQQLSGKRPYEQPHPRDTHFAADWQAKFPQPVHA